MDIVVMLFAMSLSNNMITEPPKQPQALVVEVVKLNTDTVDVHSDMWDPKWIEKK